MLFSLANLKKRSVRDPDGEQAVVPKLLHGRAALKLLDQAICAFDSHLGRPRSEYDGRDLEAVMGDYRLGRCVEACLLTRYSFVQPQLSGILSPEHVAALAEKGLAEPSALRFALWDAANADYGGFVSPDERPQLLSRLAAEWGLPGDPALVDALLSLDSEGAAILTLMGERPTPRDVMRLYNRGAVQTLLAHSTDVRFDASSLPGAALKRLYFMAKRRGVLVEIEEAGAGYSLTLYGPEQAFGTAEKYGRRLAEISLSLLRSIMSLPEQPEVAGTAHLLLHDRPYRFHLTGEVLDRLEYAPETEHGARAGRIAETTAIYSVGSAIEEVHDEEDAPAEEPSFDSLLEARMYKEFKSLQKGGYTHGWLLQREPDPLLAPGIVLIPDFAFLRGGTRVFMEIAGFWSPSYRERKLSKLRSLADMQREDTALILAMPQDAVQAFPGLPFPIIPYKNSVRVTDVLALLDTHYGQREERIEAAQSQRSSLRDEARERGFVPEQKVAETMQAYTRSELLALARTLEGDGCRYVAGIGLLSKATLEKLYNTIKQALDEHPAHRIPLDEAASLAAATLAAPSADIEALAQLWPEWRIERPSLFEAYLAQ
ncbi:MAG TPA: DUF790 family protein [Chloroflexia bacterium]|nr:DUF790 family protein [Chloroflexia bacterium]